MSKLTGVVRAECREQRANSKELTAESEENGRE
jgi:hypothetical protein